MASSQPSTRTARPTRVSSTDSAAAPPWRTRTWRRTGSALLPGGQLADADRTRRLPGREDRPGDPALAQGGQRGLGRAPAVDHHGGDAGADGGLEGGVPAVVDLHQVDQRADDAVDVAQQLAPAGALQVGQRTLQRLGPGRRAVAAPPRPRRPTPAPPPTCARPLRARRCAPPARPPARRSPAPARRPAWPGGRPAPPRPPSAPRACPPAPRASPGPPARVPRHGPPTRCATAPGRWPGPARRRRAPWPSAPAAPSPRRRGWPARPRAPPARAPRRPPPRPRAVTSSLARRAASASRVETTSTSAAASRAATTPRLRSRSTPVSPRARSTSPCTRPSALARSSSRREDSSAVVEVASASSCSSASCSSCSSSRHTAQVLHRRRAAGGQVGLLGPGEIPPHRQQLRRHAVVRARRRGLPLERPDLAPHLADQVAQALEVLGGGGQPALGPLAAAAVLQDARRLLDDGPPVLGPGVEHGVELALADDHVLLAAHTRVAEQLLDVEQPARRPVDGVLAVAGAEERPGDGDLGQVDRQLARRVVDGERHLGPAQLGPRGGPGENDVLHLRRAQRARPLGAEHPGHGVDDVGLAAPVGPDHHGDPGLELQHRRVGEGLETLHAERLQEHRGDPTGCLRAAWELTPGSVRRRRSSARPPSPARWCCGSAGRAGPRGRRPGASPGSRRARRRGRGTARRPATNPGA